MRFTRYFLGLVVVIFSINWTLAASFDCKKAVQNVEHTICDDETLDALDEHMATMYTLLKTRSSPDVEYEILSTQRTWLKDRKIDCPDLTTSCLIEKYAMRINDLETFLVQEFLRGKNCHNSYFSPHTINLFDGTRWKKSLVYNHLKIRALERKYWTFHLTIIGKNMNICDVRGVATREKDTFKWSLPNFLINEQQSCQLTMRKKGKNIQLFEEENSHCKVYCGKYAEFSDKIYVPAGQLGKKQCGFSIK